MKKIIHKLHIPFIQILALLIGAQLLCCSFPNNYGPNLPVSDTYDSVSLSGLLSLPLLNLKPTQANIDNLQSSVTLSLEEVEYLEQVKTALKFSEDALDMLSQNGFVVISNLHMETMEDVYCTVFRRDLPVLITTDSILHLYHLIFDNLLKDVEKEHLIPMTKQLTRQLSQKSFEFYLSVPSSHLKEAAKEVLLYFSVAASLIDRGFYIPSPVHDEATTIVQKILDAEIVEQYPGEDYTQYKPRGHYEEDPELQSYFRCMMWLGRKIFAIDKDESLLPAVVATHILFSNEETLTLWKRVYQVTSLFAGVADSITPISLHNATNMVFGEPFQLNRLEDANNIQKLRTELEKPQYTTSKIFSSVIYLKIHDEPMEFPKIFQFMGQRFVPDSYVLQNVTYDRVPPFKDTVRLLGSGLDVAAVLGSERAIQNLESEIQKYNYKRNLDSLTNEFAKFPKEYWESSLYFSWLYILRPLLTTIPDECYPSFMQTFAWQDEKLNTVLGSWAQLRHDTILYAKQPYSIGIICEIPTGYVEPYPEFYNGMQALCLETISFLEEVQVLNPSWESVLEEMANITLTLYDISEKELSGATLTKEEMDFIRNVAVVKDSGICGEPPKKLGWYPTLIEKANIEDSKVPCIADVMTAAGDLRPRGQPPQVLHAATGYVTFIIVIYETPQGETIAAVGPVFSYYEFPMLGFQRLSDSEWNEMLQKGTAPHQPDWTETYTAQGR
ncbi:MAG: DUF3160 domain-containing protein [Candidatus Bathyarchaeota archaeon]|nr:DUF3160 domain-containing protein [Candidatus Bathyarchaeota archaeon]MDH5732595.1 DUF3160 domain-containing protein [Candidatus Bathyarchaeota archaeon]